MRNQTLEQITMEWSPTLYNARPYSLFLPQDSHWTRRGGFFGPKDALQKLTQERKRFFVRKEIIDGGVFSFKFCQVKAKKWDIAVAEVERSARKSYCLLSALCFRPRTSQSVNHAICSSLTPRYWWSSSPIREEPYSMPYVWALPVWEGGLKACPDGLGY